MKRSAQPFWRPRYSYCDALVNDLCAVGPLMHQLCQW
jgi:hypothetical protein